MEYERLFELYAETQLDAIYKSLKIYAESLGLSDEVKKENIEITRARYRSKYKKRLRNGLVVIKYKSVYRRCYIYEFSVGLVMAKVL